MQVTLKILRYNPEKDAQPHYERYSLDAEPTDRILDVLEKIKAYQDGTLTFRRSCAHGICGSCAMRINGRNRLACKTLLQTLDTSKEITIEPILGLPKVKDLVVDMTVFFENYRKVMPYFINDEPLPEDGRERLQSPEERERFDDTTKCILCGACTTACPTFWGDNQYLGPSAIVNAHRFIFDSRDRGAAERLKILAGNNGVFRCRTAFNCTEACPREIKITKAIAEVKRAILTGRLD
ncbi:MAG: succinate dehydrogenase iron-sulfur subunit [Chloroflexi bacterium]|nr:succinate dehydrogenase iron-sulfur subunit [Chloroflexota bacterium]